MLSDHLHGFRLVLVQRTVNKGDYYSIQEEKTGNLGKKGGNWIDSSSRMWNELLELQNQKSFCFMFFQSSAQGAKYMTLHK